MASPRERAVEPAKQPAPVDAIATSIPNGTNDEAAEIAADLRELPASVSPDDGAPSGFDEAAESAFLAEARARGETVAPAPKKEDAPDETESKPLPSLNELVERIPPEVRETLDDLFRARFVTVKRIPKRAFKS